jgi:CO dehydrogenase nickel-insertion accessory protein CooC1
MILTVGNVKGGVGKTTLAVNIAISRALAGRDVLLVDGDEQGTPPPSPTCGRERSARPATPPSSCRERRCEPRSGNSRPITTTSSSTSAAATPAACGRR